MSKKLEMNEVCERFLENGLIVLDESCDSFYQKLKCQSVDGYLFSVALQNVRNRNLERIGEKTNPYAIYNMQLWIDKHTDGATIINANWGDGKYKGCILTLRCVCGKVFTKKWAEIRRRKNVVCPDCLKHKNSKKLKFDYVKSEFAKEGLMIIDDEYVANNIPINCIDQDGYKVKRSFSNLGYSKQPRRFSVKFNYDNYIWNVNHYFELHDIKCKALYLTGKKQGSADIIICECNCGRKFHTTLDSIKIGQYRCQVCSHHMSRAEYTLYEWLEQNDVNFIYQYMIEECKLKRKLPFDFYFPELKLIIEIDGEQHRKPISFGGDYENAIRAFEHTQKTDKIKNQYCKEHNITLIRLDSDLFKKDGWIQDISSILLM